MTKESEKLSTDLKKVLHRLLAEKHLTVTRLSKHIQVGQPVLHRIIKGDIKAPKVTTALKIANYFGININQLIGNQPLPQTINQHATGWRSIPRLTLKEALDPALLKNSPNTEYTEMGHSDKCFAVVLEGSAMEPRFHHGNIAIIDPTLEPADGNFVLAHIPGEKQAQFKQLKLDGENKYLKPLNKDFEAIHAKKIKILGVAVQVKVNLR